MRAALLPLSLLLISCDDKERDDDGRSPDFEGDADTDSDSDADSDADSDTDTDTDSLPDLTEGLDGSLCETVEGFEGEPGASSYFVGIYHADGESYQGVETWLLFANSAWQDTGGADCVVVWETSATQSAATGECTGCDYAVEVDAAIDLSTTTCPAALYSGDESWSSTYGMDLGAGSAASLYYAESGSPLAEGEITTNGSFTFRTHGSCRWF